MPGYREYPAETEEREFCAHRAPPEWLEALAPLGTDADQAFLQIAPWLIAALHHAGLVSLTHTPSPMKFLDDILNRPKDLARPFLLLVTGYPAAGACVPDIARKPLADYVDFV